MKGNTGQKKCVTCYKCGKKGHYANQCYSKKETDFLSKLKTFKFENYNFFVKTESDKMAWPSVKTTITFTMRIR